MRHGWWIAIALGINIAGAVNAQASGAFITALNKDHYTKAMTIAPSNALRTYAQWRYLRSSYATPSASELREFMNRHPEWPDMNLLQVRTEKAMFQGYASGEQISSWFASHPPISGYGKLLMARVNHSKAQELTRQAWIQGDFDKDDENRILSDNIATLTRADHIARVERLLKEDRATVAERMLNRFGADDAALYRARIALIRRDHGVEKLVDNVPPSRMDNDGLLADRAWWREAKGLESGVMELLMRMRPSSAYAQKLWPLRAKYAREMLEQRRYGDAMALLDGMGTLEGAYLADALWLRGWVKLEFIREPAQALKLFDELDAAVNFPVSKSRAAYWAGRAAERAGNSTEASSWYEKAAHHTTTFYGQLAFAKVHPGAPLRFASAPSFSNDQVTKWKDTEAFQAAQSLTRMGEYQLSDTLIRGMAEYARSDAETAALVAACQQQNMHYAQVRAAKLALQKNIVLLEQGWPMVHGGKTYDIELPLAYAISRQESEFNPDAQSPAGARGLMQLMPSTARLLARQLGVTFDLSRLSDPNYNMQLGTHYLGNLINGFDDSYTLSIAAYNAGPGRSRQWTERFGRPGYDLNQSINWIEMIPFAETRNYVQRVLENLQVYRSRLKPDQPLAIEADIKR